MKKLLASILSVCLIFCSSFSCAEENKIKFPFGIDIGMHSTEAAMKTGFEVEYLDSMEEYNERGIFGKTKLFGKTTVGGYEVKVTCYTDAADNIVQVIYQFVDPSPEQFDALEASLSKYGTEQYAGSKPIKYSAFESVITEDGRGRSDSEIINNFDRAISYKDGTLIIEHYFYNNIMSMSRMSSPQQMEVFNIVPFHIVCYSYIDASIADNEASDADF